VCYSAAANGNQVKFLDLPTDVDERTGSQTAFEHVLDQNYLNPFNPSTTIRYGLPLGSEVTLTVYNTLGQQVVTLIHGEENAGYHEAKFEGSGLATGVYSTGCRQEISCRPANSFCCCDGSR
jgi:hypothetical protein